MVSWDRNFLLYPAGEMYFILRRVRSSLCEERKKNPAGCMETLLFEIHFLTFCTKHKSLPFLLQVEHFIGKSGSDI